MQELSKAELDALIYEATVDAHDEEEQLAGFAAMIENCLTLPFKTTVLGVMVTVAEVSQSGSGIVGLCVRGKHRQGSQSLISASRPAASRCRMIAAYRRWAG